MKRTKDTNTELLVQEGKLRILSELTSRANLMNKLGGQYGGNRDIYEALGYSKDLTIKDYASQFSRQDIAQAVIERPVTATWAGGIQLIEGDDTEETELEKQWLVLDNDINLTSKLKRLDTLVGLGRYGVLLLGFNDVKESTDFANMPTGVNELLYVKPLSESNAIVQTWETNTNDPRYGLPLLYNITLPGVGSSSSITLSVHHDRVLHVAEGILENEIYGVSRLKVVFNRLKDLEKIVGGSAEMFWRGARPGYQGKVDPDYQATPAFEANLKDQIDEYENNLRRLLVNEGVDFKALESQVSDPTAHVQVQIQMISAVTGIPTRILTGSERGELASSEDKNTWLSLIDTRRTEFAEPCIIRMLVDRLIEYKVLPASKEKYVVKWEDLWAKSEKEQAEIGKIRADALNAYASNPGASYIVPPTEFLRNFLGLSDDVIEMMQKAQKENMNEENNDFNNQEDTEDE